MKRRITFLALGLFLVPIQSYASPTEIEAMKQTLEVLQKQIRIQGEEIAALKNQLEQKEAPRPVYLPPKDDEAFREQMQEMAQEFLLSKKEEIPEEKELVTLYDDGFWLKGKDDTIRIGGWWQGDLNIYDRGNEGNSRFRNRRARLDFRGVLEDYFEYRLFTQFAGTAANLQEAWLLYKYFPSARIKFGQFKVPFSLESQYSSLWVDFIEKSLGVGNLEPAEDLGLMIYGNPWGGIVEYAVGTFNGRTRVLEDNNDAFDLAGRLVLAPFKKLQQEGLRDFYVGGSLTWGHSDETLAGTGFTTAGGTRFLTYGTNARHANDRTRFGSELQWIYGPGDIKAEYVAARFNDVERVLEEDDVNVDSWYVSASYILTGERKIRDKALVPKRVFSLKDGGRGAWELAFRFEQFFVNETPFVLSLISGTNRVDAYTAGVNWWPNKHIRLMFDYTLNHFNDPVPIGGEVEGSEHLLFSRAQYNF